MKLQQLHVSGSESHDDSINALERKLLITMGLQATHDAAAGKPVTLDQFWALVLNELRAQIQHKINENEAVYLPHHQMYLAQSVEVSNNQDIQLLEGANYDNQHKIALIKEDQKHCATNFRKQRIRLCVDIAVVSIAASEGIFSYSALRFSHLSPIQAAISSIAIAAGSAAVMHLLVKQIRKIPRKKIQVILLCGIIVAASIAFYYLGQLRSAGINAENTIRAKLAHTEHSVAQISGITLSTISILLFLIGTALTLLYSKTAKEEEAEKQHDLLVQEEQACNKVIKENKAAIKDIKAKTFTSTQDACRNKETALTNENRLRSLSNTLINHYAKVNMRFRSDIPDFFVTLPVIQYTTFFDSIKKDAQ